MENESARYLVMRREASRYAVPAEFVEEIVSAPSVTELPLQPGYLRGIFNYKGHIVPALSLGALCGCNRGEGEIVCVVLRLDNDFLALTADGVETLISDDGQRLRYDESLINGELLKLRFAIPGDPAVLVLDLRRMYEAVEARLSEEM